VDAAALTISVIAMLIAIVIALRVERRSRR
jgi:hypothetical protein